ncbi:MAG: hypothetical protein IPP50_09825 [Piscinibacter sp.]|nr:hypothetical protein [Piscinibacter sp.]
MAKSARDSQRARRLIVGHQLAPALDIAGHDKHTNGSFCRPSNCAFDPERTIARIRSSRSGSPDLDRDRLQGFEAAPQAQ